MKFAGKMNNHNRQHFHSEMWKYIPECFCWKDIDLNTAGDIFHLSSFF